MSGFRKHVKIFGCYAFEVAKMIVKISMISFFYYKQKINGIWVFLMIGIIFEEIF